MLYKLLHCPHCGRIYKITSYNDNILTTDYNDKFNISSSNETHCLKCNGIIYIKDSAITCLDWIADMVFKIKGK